MDRSPRWPHRGIRYDFPEKVMEIEGKLGR
jgi:hypothetical protein